LPLRSSENNIIFRIPTPVFGAGLIENLDDSTLLNNQLVNLNNNLAYFRHLQSQRQRRHHQPLRLEGAEQVAAHLCRRGLQRGDGHQQLSCFPKIVRCLGKMSAGGTGETGLVSTCLNLGGAGYPEDTSNPGSTGPAILDDVSAFANFMRFLAPPPTGGVVLNGTTVSASAISAGSSLFSSIGCATCHNPTPGTTQASGFTSSLSKAARECLLRYRDP
jgi:hypothetical protein